MENRSGNKIAKEIREYADIFKKLTEEEQEKLKMTLLNNMRDSM